MLDDGMTVGPGVQKAEVNYRNSEDRVDTCGACLNFKEPDKCKQVLGTVSPLAVCDLYESRDRATADAGPGAGVPPDLMNMLFGGPA